MAGQPAISVVVTVLDISHWFSLVEYFCQRVPALGRSTKNMKTILTTTFALIGVLVISSCSTPGELPPLSSVRPGVASEGTLANPALAQDASLAIRKTTGGNKRVIKFVIQQPVGQPGSKVWREMWIYDPEGKKQQFIMTFREDGQGSADFKIQKM